MQTRASEKKEKNSLHADSWVKINVYFCSMFTRQIAKFIASERLLSHDARVLVALSGGADSVALFCVLKQLGYALSAVHCNFHLRGAESDRDETFVRDLCRKEHVPLEVVHFDTIAYAARHKMSIEMAARELRYEAFETLRREQGAEAIAVAHHRDDSVETLLLNLIRGTGINGLKGIRPRNGYVIRPLLAVSRQDITDYLERIGQAYVTDSTNLHDDYTRNKVRLNILPLMEQINPSVKDSLTETAARLNEVAILYNKVMKAETQCISTHLPDGTLHIDQTKWQASDTPKSLLYELLSPYGFRPAQIDDICLSARHTPGRRFRSATHEVLSDRVNASTLKEPEEIKLAMQVVVLRDKLEPYFTEGRYQDALVELAELREPVDAFFDKVMVMVDDKELRINRLTMLEKLRELFLRVADISLLQ